MASAALLLLVAISAGPPAVARAPEGERPLPVFDMHLHAKTAPTDGRPTSLCLPVMVHGVVDPRCDDPLVAPATDEEMIARNVEILERRNVYGVISGDLETVRRFRDAAPDRLLPALQFEMGEGDVPEIDDLRRHILAGEIAVLGEGYPGAPYLGSPRYRIRAGNPLLLEDVLARHPKLRIYVMHFGSPLVDEMIAVMGTYPNVYIDVGGNTWPYPREYFYGQLEQFVNAGFGKRILFGSDQMHWPELIEISIEIIEQAPFLSDEQKRDILYGNAARFLRLSDEEIARHHGEPASAGPAEESFWPAGQERE